MKAKYLIISLLFTVSLLNAAINKWLVGDWQLVEFKLIQKGTPVVSDEKMLRDAGAVWDLHFSSEGEFRQDFNMRTQAMKMETEKGKWNTEKDSLYIDLQVDTLTNRLNYSYVILGDVIVLTMGNPGNQVISKFRRK